MGEENPLRFVSRKEYFDKRYHFMDRSEAPFDDNDKKDIAKRRGASDSQDPADKAQMSEKISQGSPRRGGGQPKNTYDDCGNIIRPERGNQSFQTHS